MIGLDTNILVRYLTQDDAAQTRAATRLIEHNLSAHDPGMILAIVLAETLWVLGDLYDATNDEQIDCVERLLKTRQFEIQHRAAITHAVGLARNARCGVTDCLIAEIALAEGCTQVATFDKKAAKTRGYALLPT